MRVIKVQQGQNLFDVAIVTMGSALGAMLIAGENNLSVTDTLKAGQELRIPEELISKSVVRDLMKNGVKPATGMAGISEEMAIHYAVASYAGYNYWK